MSHSMQSVTEAADADRSDCLGDRVWREAGRCVDIAGETVLDQLDRGHQRAGIFVFVGQRVDPAREKAGTAAALFLRWIWIVGHRAAADMEIGMIVPVNESGMDGSAIRVDTRRALKPGRSISPSAQPRRCAFR